MPPTGAFAELAVVLKAIFDSSGLGEMDALIRKSVKEVDGQVGDLGKSMEQIGGKIAEWALDFVSVQKASEFLWDSFKAASESEKLFAQLNATLKVSAHATEAQVAQTKEWAEAQGLAYGKTNAELIPSLQKLVAVTGDVSQAQFLMGVALDASKAFSIDLGTATDSLTRYLQTGKVRGTDPMAASIRHLEEESKKAHAGHVNHAEVLGRLQEQMAKTAEGVNTTATALDQQKVRWERTKEAIGEQLLTLKDDLIPVMRAVAIGLAMVQEGWANIGAVATGAMEQFDLVVEALEDIAQFRFGAAKDALGRAADDFINTVDRMVTKNHEVVARVEKAWADVPAKVQQSAAEQGKALAALGGHMDHLKDKVEDASKSALEAWKLRELNIEKSTTDEVAKLRALSAMYAEMANDPHLNPTQQAEAAVKAKKLVEEADTKELANRRRIFDEERQMSRDRATIEGKSAEDVLRLEIAANNAELANFKLTEAEKLKVQADTVTKQKQLAAGLLAALKADDQAELAQYQQGSLAQLQVRKRQIAEELKLARGQKKEEDKLRAEELKLDRLLSKEKVKLALQTASQMLGLAQGAFGNHKEIAIAQALINTYEAATGAYAAMAVIPIVGPFLGAAAAALAVVAGLKNVSEIKSADATQGKGFDDDRNDLVATLGGERWAKDFTEKFSAGVMGGMAKHFQGAGDTVHNYNYNQPGQVVHNRSVNVATLPMHDSGKDQANRELARTLRTYMFLDGKGDVG